MQICLICMSNLSTAIREYEDKISQWFGPFLHNRYIFQVMSRWDTGFVKLTSKVDF